MTTPTHQEKIDWMIQWAHKNKVVLELHGECGFGRECVGIMAGDSYPDYRWYTDDYTDRADKNGDVWTPQNAYHKHPCVAVLGRGENAEAQLYDWLKWFEDNGFKMVEEMRDLKSMSPIEILLRGGTTKRMVRQSTV